MARDVTVRRFPVEIDTNCGPRLFFPCISEKSRKAWMHSVDCDSIRALRGLDGFEETGWLGGNGMTSRERGDFEGTGLLRWAQGSLHAVDSRHECSWEFFFSWYNFSNRYWNSLFHVWHYNMQFFYCKVLTMQHPTTHWTHMCSHYFFVPYLAFTTGHNAHNFSKCLPAIINREERFIFFSFSTTK